MLAEWRLEIPDNKGRNFIYHLEMIYHRISQPTHFSIFHREIDYKKFKPEHLTDNSIVHQWGDKLYTVEDMWSNAYNFDSLGRLAYVSLHDGDFTAPGFRWADESRAEYQQDIPAGVQKKAYSAAGLVLSFLKAQREGVENKTKQQRYDLFVSPLERVIKTAGKF